MPDLQQIAAKATDTTVEATAAANTQVVATLAAAANYRWYITGYEMSTDGNLAAKVTCSVVSGALVLSKFNAPAALPVDRVVEFTRPIKCPQNTSVVATLPAGGAGIVGEVVLRGYLVFE